MSIHKKHLVLKISGVENVDLLKDAELLEHALDGIIKALQMKIVGRVKHQFKPFGATMIYLLAESHCSAHTYWEEREVYLDLFYCSDFDERVAVQMFCNVFGSEQSDWQMIER